MKDRSGSNPTFSAIKTLVFTDVLKVSAPSGNRSAPDVEYIDFMVEGPKKSIEMKHQIKAVNCNGNIAQRWYVEYYITDRVSNKRIRKRDYGYINKSKDLAERTKLLLQLKSAIVNDLLLQENKKIEFEFDNTQSITFYFNEYLREKASEVEDKTVKNYRCYLSCFHQFLLKNNFSQKSPSSISKQLMYEFRSELSSKLTNRGTNNHMDCVKGFFSYLIKRYDNLLYKNPCEGLIKLQSKSESHVAYTQKQAIEISDFLKETDLQMLYFCRFVGYGFLRCNETRRLKISDINFDNKTITLPARKVKSKKRTVKPMLTLFYKLLLKMKLQNYPSDYYVFSPGGSPGLNMASDSYFRKKYKAVKKKFKLEDYYTIYGFRHTMVCELLDSGAKWQEIMKYTGHTTFAAFEKYARALLNRPAVDLSSNISIKF